MHQRKKFQTSKLDRIHRIEKSADVGQKNTSLIQTSLDINEVNTHPPAQDIKHTLPTQGALHRRNK